MNIPTIETERLLLRAFRDFGLDAYAAMRALLGGPVLVHETRTA